VSDEELLCQFENCTLDGGQWTHRSHVKVAFLYLRRFPFEEALEHLRRGIKSYNASRHVEEGPTSGYNETTTVAFAHLIAATDRAYGMVMPTSTADEFCDTHPQLMSAKLLRLYYSPEQRMKPEAKTVFVPPDLAPFPHH